jgi:hypothetical protein
VEAIVIARWWCSPFAYDAADGSSQRESETGGLGGAVGCGEAEGWRGEKREEEEELVGCPCWDGEEGESGGYVAVILLETGFDGVHSG